MNCLKQTLPFLLLALGACSDVEDGADGHDHHHHDHEVITTIVLNFTPAEGDVVSASWSDLSGDIEVDDITLIDATQYSLSLEILNELEEPIEDVTPEIADESDEHQLFFTGSAVNGPATQQNDDAIVEHAYADEDVNRLPVGLTNDITAIGTGSGDFIVTMRHMPLQNGNTIKTEGGAEAVASDGFGAIGGDNDFQITFSMTVE